MNKEITNWLLSEMDFFSGCALFAKYCKNKIFVRSIISNPKNFNKLEYELKKLAGIPLSLLFTQNCSNKELIQSIEKKEKIKIVPKGKTSKVAKVPKVVINQNKEQHTYYDPIALAKIRIKDLYVKIDKMHSQLYDLGESNAPDIIAKRLEILEKRKKIIKKYDELYQLKEAYFNTGKIDPKMKELLKTK